MIKKVLKRNNIIYFVLPFLFTIIILMGLKFYFEYQSNKMEFFSICRNEKNLVELMTAELSNKFNSVQTDLNYIGFSDKNELLQGNYGSGSRIYLIDNDDKIIAGNSVEPIISLEEWNKIKLQGLGQSIINKGLVTYKQIKTNNKNSSNSDSIIYLVSIFEKNNNNQAYFNQELAVSDFFQKNINYFFVVVLIGIINGIFCWRKCYKYSRLKYYFKYDVMTKAYNRNYGLNKLKSLLKSSNIRYNNGALCFIDINGLKQTNDKYGHKYGDELIKEVVNVINSAIRRKDFVIRLGGDEFLIVFVGVTQEIAEQRWQDILKIYGENNKKSGKYLISVSHGIVNYSKNSNLDIDDLIHSADKKMYEEKKLIAYEKF